MHNSCMVYPSYRALWQCVLQPRKLGCDVLQRCAIKSSIAQLQPVQIGSMHNWKNGFGLQLMLPEVGQLRCDKIEITANPYLRNALLQVIIPRSHVAM